MAVPNHCVCHGSSLPVKAAFRDIKILENFSTQTQDLLRMFKKSPQKDAYLQYAKDAAPSDDLRDKPSEVGGLIEWCMTRWAENKKALQAIKNNLPYMQQVCDQFSDPKVLGDAFQRNRSKGHSVRLCAFEYMFLIFMRIDWLGIIDSMNKSFQNPSITISQVISIAERAINVLNKSRMGDHWGNFCKLCLRYTEIYKCVDQPTLHNIARRRQRRNYAEIQNYFAIDGMEPVAHRKSIALNAYCHEKIVTVRVKVSDLFVEQSEQGKQFIEGFVFI